MPSIGEPSEPPEMERMQMPTYLDAIKLIFQQYGQAVLGVVIMVVMMIFVFNPMLKMKTEYEDERRSVTMELLKISSELKEATQHLKEAIQIQDRNTSRTQ